LYFPIIDLNFTPRSERVKIIQWLKELNDYSKGTPIILVATKIDIRDDKAMVEQLAKDGEKVLTQEDGDKLAKEIGAAYYIETSARTRKGVDEIFQKALDVRFAKGGKPAAAGGSSGTSENKGCCIMM